MNRPLAYDPESAAASDDAEDEWRLLAGRTRQSARTLAPLPAFTPALLAQRELLFRVLGYSFWNRELLDGLASRFRLEGPCRWVELAAGTGRWAAEMARRGVDVAATDDYSQAPERVRGSQRPLQYGSWVERLSAREATARLRPQGVLCAWPPLGSCLVPDLLAGALPGSGGVRQVVCVGEPGGATEAPVHPGELPEGWLVDSWPECEPYLIGFNDPPPGPGWRSHARLLVYRRRGGVAP